MRPLRDPEGAELHHLLNACHLAGMEVLEIGCGDGKFTFQYSELAKRVTGIDPEMSDLQVARRDKRGAKSFFIQCEGEHLPFPAEAFDIAIFGSSL